MTNRIEKTIDLAAPVERVWRALTDHKEFGTWFRVKLDQPFEPGVASTGRMTYPGYEHVPWNATVVEMAEPTLFSFTWPHMDEAAGDYAAEPRTLVEFRLEPTANGTKLTITESGFDALPAHRRAENYRGNEGGWAEQLRNIKAHVEA